MFLPAEGSEMNKWKGRMTGKGFVERRKHRRFKVHNGAFAALSYRFTTLGRIADISRGGLSFRYVASKDQSNGSRELKIFLTDGSFCFDKVPSTRIWDLAIPNEFSFGSITIRQCGVQFQDMTGNQKSDLEYFIQNCTIREALTSH
jgi:hypothetical protein